jgi:hypothetical protein
LQHNVQVVVPLHIVHAYKTRHVICAVQSARPGYTPQLLNLLLAVQRVQDVLDVLEGPVNDLVVVWYAIEAPGLQVHEYVVRGVH